MTLSLLHYPDNMPVLSRCWSPLSRHCGLAIIYKYVGHNILDIFAGTVSQIQKQYRLFGSRWLGIWRHPGHISGYYIIPGMRGDCAYPMDAKMHQGWFIIHDPKNCVTNWCRVNPNTSPLQIPHQMGHMEMGSVSYTHLTLPTTERV